MKSKILYDKLLSEGIIGAKGQSVFQLNGLETVVCDSSIVGNVIQEWLKTFMDKHNVFYRVKQNTQEFPDFLMNKDSDKLDLLEVKCFKKSPNFDVANFQAYARSLLSTPYRLDSDYLIFEYEELAKSIAIKNLWIKKVWQISGASERASIKIQWKQNIPVNIRPAIWYSARSKYPAFSSRRDFVLAIKKVLDTSSVSGDIQRNWFSKVEQLYLQQTGNPL